MPAKKITLNDLKNTACWRLNPHLHEEVQEKKRRKPRRPTKEVKWVEQELRNWCEKKGFVLLVEHKFNEYRKFSFDFAIEEIMIAVEFEGGIWMKGGGAHSRPAAIERDIEKYNLAQSMGWTVIRIHRKTYTTIIEQIETIKEV